MPVTEQAAEALELLAPASAQVLGITTDGSVVKASLPDAPDGVQLIRYREWDCIYLPLEMNVFVRLC